MQIHQEKIKEIVSVLDPQLSRKIAMTMHYVPLKSHVIISVLFEDRFIQDLALTLENNIYMPKDIIIDEDDKENKNAYYIYNGVCIVYHKRSGIDLNLKA